MYVSAHVATQARQDLPGASHPPPQPAGATNHLILPRPANLADAGADGDNESSDTDAASREEVAQNEGRLKRYVPAFGLDSEIPLRGLRIGPPHTHTGARALTRTPHARAHSTQSIARTPPLIPRARRLD